MRKSYYIQYNGIGKVLDPLLPMRVESLFRKEIDYGFALIRPAGHHSSIDQIATFCGLNSICIGAIKATGTMTEKMIVGKFKSFSSCIRGPILFLLKSITSRDKKNVELYKSSRVEIVGRLSGASCGIFRFFFTITYYSNVKRDANCGHSL